LIVPRNQPISSTMHFHEHERESRVCGQGRLSIAYEIQDSIKDVSTDIVKCSYTVVERGHFGNLMRQEVIQGNARMKLNALF
jgi:hypothetical protein